MSPPARLKCFFLLRELLDHFETDAEGVGEFVPVGAEKLKTAYLRGGTDMLSYAGTDIVVAYAHKTDGVGCVVGQTVGTDLVGQLVASDILVGDGEVVGYQFIHSLGNEFLLFLVGLVVDDEGHLALLALYVSIAGAFATKETHHGLVEKVLGGVGWRKLFLVVWV